MLKKLLSTVAAVLAASAISYSANITSFNTVLSGCNEASQLLNCINQLITAVTAGVNGNVGTNTVAVSSIASTGFDQQLMTVTVPPNTLTAAGQSLRARCFGTFGANNNSKTIKAFVTSTSTPNGAIIASLVSTINGGSWNLELLVTYAASATNSNWVGRGEAGTFTTGVAFSNIVSPVVASNSVIDFRTAITASCGGVTPTAAGDITVQELTVEQIK